MKKKYLKVLIISAVFLGLGAVPAHSIPTVSLNLLDSEIFLGESFAVEVIVDGDNIGQELLNFGFNLSTTGSFFTYDGFTLGLDFDDDSLFNPADIAGSWNFVNFNDDYLLATLDLTATSIGTGILGVSGIVMDNPGFLGLYYSEFLSEYDIDASLEIQVNSSTAPVPEPATIILLASGLFGMGVFGRKKFNK
jgi:hypothetical protein